MGNIFGVGYKTPRCVMKPMTGKGGLFQGNEVTHISSSIANHDGTDVRFSAMRMNRRPGQCSVTESRPNMWPSVFDIFKSRVEDRNTKEGEL